MTTIYHAVEEINAKARELVRNLEAAGMQENASQALAIVDRAGEIKRALGMPANVTELVPVETESNG